MARKPFKLRSGNVTPFKQMASVPVVAPPTGGMAAPAVSAPPPPPPPPAPVSPAAVPQLKKKYSIAKELHPEVEEKDKSYVKNPDTSGAVTGEVSTPTLDAITRKLNKLKNTDTEGMSNAQLTVHSNKLKAGKSAYNKEFNKMRKARSTS